MWVYNFYCLSEHYNSCFLQTHMWIPKKINLPILDTFFNSETTERKWKCTISTLSTLLFPWSTFEKVQSIGRYALNIANVIYFSNLRIVRYKENICLNHFNYIHHKSISPCSIFIHAKQGMWDGHCEIPFIVKTLPSFQKSIKFYGTPGIRYIKKTTIYVFSIFTFLGESLLCLPHF